MPKYQFEARELRSYSDVVVADSLEEAKEIIRDDVGWFSDDFSEVEIDWIEEVED